MLQNIFQFKICLVTTTLASAKIVWAVGNPTSNIRNNNADLLVTRGIEHRLFYPPGFKNWRV